MRDIEIVNEFNPDYIGFVFTESKRKVGGALAAQLKKALIASIRVVGVFADEQPTTIERLRGDGVIDVIQLHGDEDDGYIAALKKLVNAPIIKAVRVSEAGELLEEIPNLCDYILLDTYQKNRFGGSGKPFDWNSPIAINKPLFLSGGLNLDNVAGGIRRFNPYCCDCSSGVETEGIKDRIKIKNFIETVRRSENG